jgi:multiple sugar transport system substrate-binding protein
MYRKPITRRQFIKKAAGTAMGLSSFSIFQPPRVTAATPELTILSWNHFVPTSDDKLREQAARFAKEQGVIVRVDTMAHLQIPAKLAAEIHAQTGHDIIWLFRAAPWLYQEQLIDVDEVIEDLGEKQGGWYPFVKEASFVKDSWKAVPWFWISSPGLYREDLFAQAGLQVPRYWEDVLNAGRILKKEGHPVGIPISQCNDAIGSFWAILWGFGGKVLEADGKTLALNSPEMEAILAFYKSLYEEAMEPEVLSWDDASNNRFLLSGKGCWIHNPISAYATAVEKKMAIADKIGVHSALTGPAGKYGVVGTAGLGIWKFSKNQELAKAFIKYLMQPENYTEWIVASRGFNHGPLRMYENHPIWTEHPKMKILPGEAQFAHIPGWPSPPNAYIERINELFILPNMVAKVVTGTPIKTAITWAEEQIRRVLET